VAAVLADPSLGTADLLSIHLLTYKRWHEQATFVEFFPLPFLERYAAPDRRLTRLCRRLTQQVNWPLPSPLVGAFSNNYYWTLADFSLICAPAAEGVTLLGLPDLCHELGHILLVRYEGAIIGDIVQELTAYVAQEQRQAESDQRPGDHREVYEGLLALWRDAWVREFASDMIATYLVGPAFGWQHVRLCASLSHAAYHPALGEAAEHPADAARLRGVVAVLDHLGRVADGERVRVLWDQYMAATGEDRPLEYAVCYPHALIDSLAARVIAGCQTLGIRSFQDSSDAAGDLVSLLAGAWEQFLTTPQTYTTWEDLRLTALWSDLEGDGP